MKGARLLILVLILLALASVPSAAAPLQSAPLRDFVADPCPPGTAYHPACDVDQNNQINILDIQRTASRFNQSGTWVSDNNHNHLGQWWSGGFETPLEISGVFSNLDHNAPLVLSNDYPGGSGYGLRVSAWGTGVYVKGATAGLNRGVWVQSASNGFVVSSAYTGVSVDSANYNGVFVGEVGSPSTHAYSSSPNGFEVAGAEGNGLYVGRADENGIVIRSAGDDGVQIGEDNVYPTYGLYVPTPGTPNNALWPNTANAAGEWALYTVDKIRASNVSMDAQTLVAVVSADQPLSSGDVVAAIGLADPIPGSLNHLAQVRLATADQANVVGVVSSRMALQPAPGKEGEQVMHSTDGPAQPGDYVAITVLGVAQVKVQDGEAIQPGQRLTVAATPGHARALQSKLIEGMMVTEGAPVIGTALEASRDGLVWVLVNPQ